MACLLIWTATPARLLAADAVPDFQYDAVEYWAAQLLTWMVLLSLVIAVYALQRVWRGQLNGLFGKGVLLAGVVMLPSFSVATGMLLVFARAERVEFCGSCHRALQGHVDDMTDPSSQGLAAVHYRYQYIPSNQCFECHSSYGLFGTLEAKIQGIREVVRYYTGTYEVPISIWRPYSNGDCLKCHAQSELWRARSEHTDGQMQNDLFEDTVSCMGCHVAAHQVATAAVGGG
jgi:nitrate/TMAO reductase-like tetraheme cytochrome c subunit